MKRILAIILILCLCLGLCACGKEEVVENPKLRIGVFEPFTGPDGRGGLQEVLGVQYAHSKTPSIKLGDQTYDIELVYADNASSRIQAPQVAQALLEQGVSLVIGSHGSGVSMAAGEVFKSAGVAAIGASCTNPAVTENCASYFRVCYTDDFQGLALAAFAKEELGVETVFCLGQVENEYDQSLINSFRSAAEILGITVIKSDFSENTDDFSYFINNAVSQGADLIFAPCSLRYAKVIAEQMSALEEPLPMLGGDSWDSYELLEAVAGKNLKIYVSAFYAQGASSSFESGFKEWINAEGNENSLANNGGTDAVSALTVMGYDAYNMAIAAIQAAGSDHYADILAVLPAVSATAVGGGLLSFDSTGDANRTSAVIKRADTENVVWKFVKNQGIE